MAQSFPSVSNNSCGALGRKTSTTQQDITVEGGGIYNAGTLNLRNAFVSANDFAEGDIDVPNASQDCTLNNAIHVKRDEATGLALYNYVDASGNKTEITRLDNRFNENLELVTEAIEHEKHGIYGTRPLAYYQGSNALYDLSVSTDETDREFFHEFCRFVVNNPVRTQHSGKGNK